MKRIFLIVTLFMALAIANSAVATPTANYFRVWQGFKKPSLSYLNFLNEIPAFMEETSSLYSGYNALNSYIVVIPPANKPDYIPDELALVGLASEEIYKEIRQTPEGKAYSERHWDVFDKETSSSAKTFVNYSKEKPSELIHNAAYDMLGKSIDWSSGYTKVFIGLRKDNVSAKEFLSILQNHVELVKETLESHGLNGYIVIANEKYEVAYMNWVSKKAYEKFNQNNGFKLVSEDASQFMNTLMYAEAKVYEQAEKTFLATGDTP